MNLQIFAILIGVGALCLFTGLYGAMIFAQSTIAVNGSEVPTSTFTMAGIALILYGIWRWRKR